MFEIVTSNATEELLAALGRDLAASRRAAPAALSFLDEAVVLVPDRHVATYLKLGLARETGLCANVRFEYLKSFFADLIGRAAPRGAAPPRVADGDGLTGLVLRVLLDEARLAHAELGPAREYVHAGADEPGRDLRRYQLAVQLARLYEEYSYSRPELLAAWRRGRSGGRDPHGAERWQRRVWLEIFGQGGVLTGRDAPAGGWITLDELVAPGGRVRLDELPAPPRVWAFGFSYLARLVLDLLAALGRRAEVRLYALSACVEDEAAFATAAARLAAGPPDDPFGLAAAAPATLRWARPAREGLRLAAAAGARVTPRPRDPLAAAADAAPPPPTLLRTLQHELLTGNNEARLRLASGAPGPVPPALGGGDGSLRILRCPSVRREAEVVANEIWSLVERDPALRFHEIAVIVGGRDRAAYLTHLAAALRECHGIPHSLADLSLAGESRVVEAVDLLLGLPLAGTTRQEVLRVATHPAVLRARFPEASADDWARWCDRLGIVHGADHADHAATYIEPDVFNWDQGLRRLALGAFMAGARSGEARGVALGEEEYVVEETGAPASAAQLGLLVRSLMADAAGARAARLTLPAWADVLAALVHTYVGADG
ncbi:MAG TPA: exodeoxyribonuclease V subunit gamma, partial [Polyangia bacterium]